MNIPVRKHIDENGNKSYYSTDSKEMFKLHMGFNALSDDDTRQVRRGVLYPKRYLRAETARICNGRGVYVSYIQIVDNKKIVHYQYLHHGSKS